MKIRMLAAALGLAALVPQAQAALFSFSINTSQGVLAATVDGTLQADLNTVAVNSVLDFATLGGSPLASIGFVDSADFRFLGSGTAGARLTLDGSFLDFLACTDSTCFEGFLLAAGSAIAGSFGGPFVNSSASFGSLFESPDMTSWQMTANQTPVPAPATLPLLAIGGLALAARRRKTA